MFPAEAVIGVEVMVTGLQRIDHGLVPCVRRPSNVGASVLLKGFTRDSGVI